MWHLCNLKINIDCVDLLNLFFLRLCNLKDAFRQKAPSQCTVTVGIFHCYRSCISVYLRKKLFISRYSLKTVIDARQLMRETWSHVSCPFVPDLKLCSMLSGMCMALLSVFVIFLLVMDAVYKVSFTLWVIISIFLASDAISLILLA